MFEEKREAVMAIEAAVVVQGVKVILRGSVALLGQRTQKPQSGCIVASGVSSHRVLSQGLRPRARPSSTSQAWQGYALNASFIACDLLLTLGPTGNCR